MNRRRFLNIALLYAFAIAAGYVLSRLHVPLPWMIGPMALTAVLAIAGKTPKVPGITRLIGQLIVAASVGLFFTPAAMNAVSQQIAPMIAVSLLTIVAGFAAAIVLMRLTRIDVVTASLASIPGGPVEMAAFAVRYGAQPGPVVFAQILRVALLVLILPPLLVALDGGMIGSAGVPSAASVDYPGALLLLVLAVCGAFLLRAIRITSPFFLGPLAAGAIASATLLPVSVPPFPILAGAQVLLGIWLGSMFDRDLFIKAGGLVPALFASTAVLLVLCALMALAISALTGLEWQTMILATAPGSVTEMALTAKILEHNVALVTAFHVLRIFIIIPAAPLVFALTARLAKRLPK